MDDSTRQARVSRKENWGFKRSSVAVIIGVLAAACSVFLPRGTETKTDYLTVVDSSACRFPAIYNFGDSNSDTGGRSAAFSRLPSPYGNAFLGEPSGRFSDGHVVIDFMARKLGLPSVSAYLDSIGSDFHHGANFATGGSTIQPIDGKTFDARYSPISLDVQLLQFQQLKARTHELFAKGIKTRLPLPEDFSQALYTFDIGQNDLHVGFKFMTEEQVEASLPNITHQFASVIKVLYREGARVFWIHNTGPIGCLPLNTKHPSASKPDNLDEVGCVKSHNKIAQELNRQLKERISELRAMLTGATLTYVDMYSAKYILISEAEKHGFTNPLGFCCGHYRDHLVMCGTKSEVNGVEVYGESCSNPSEYISWDGIHYSHAAHEWIASKVLDGSFSDPPIPVVKACQSQ